MFSADGCTVNLILPVGGCCTILHIGGHTSHCRSKGTELISREHIKTLGHTAYRDIAVVIELQGTVSAFLGGDDNHTVRCTRTVDGCCRSILQHSESLDVVGVDTTEHVAATLDGRVVNRHTVDHNQRVVAGRERGTATDADSGT